MPPVPPEVALVREHLIHHLQQPKEVVRLTQPSTGLKLTELEVACFYPGGPSAPGLFVTCGASTVPMADGRRIEGLMMVRGLARPGLEALVKLLGGFATFAERQKVSLGVGDVIAAKDELASISKMDAVLLVPPVPLVESFHRIRRNDGKTIELYWVLPVYQAEADYSLAHGPGHLMALFAASELDLTALDRAPADTSLDPKAALARAEEVETRRMNALYAAAKAQEAAASPEAPASEPAPTPAAPAPAGGKAKPAKAPDPPKAGKADPSKAAPKPEPKAPAKAPPKKPKG